LLQVKSNQSLEYMEMIKEFGSSVSVQYKEIRERIEKLASDLAGGLEEEDLRQVRQSFDHEVGENWG